MKGFSYNGKHCSEFGVYYVPEAIGRGDFQSDFEIKDMERSWFPGGAYFEARIKTREFELDCFYDQITYAQRERLLRWLDRRTSGELVFDERPYAVYRAHITKKIDFRDYKQYVGDNTFYSGTFTVTFSAYYPFAEFVPEAVEATDERMLAETNWLGSAYAPPSATPSDTDLLVYNPGTEQGHSIIRFAGSTGTSAFRIYNATTGDVCVLGAGLETQNDDYIEIDSKNGRMETVSGTFRTLNYIFHDESYITFAPSEIAARDIVIQTTASSKEIAAAAGTFSEDMVGKYIFADGKWRYIGNYISDSKIEVNAPPNATKTETSCIAILNYLTFEKGLDANITRLEVICKAEVR